MVGGGTAEEVHVMVMSSVTFTRNSWPSSGAEMLGETAQKIAPMSLNVCASIMQILNSQCIFNLQHATLKNTVTAMQCRPGDEAG